MVKIESMTKKAYELDFISQINRNGTGTVSVSKNYVKYMTYANDEFTLHRLSLTEKTFIAFNFNAFVVRLK